MQSARKGKPAVICNKCHKMVNIKPRYKTVNGIEYTYFTCKKCGGVYVVSATDEALRQDIKKYKEMAEKARKGCMAEKEHKEMQEMLQANVTRSRELKEQYLFNAEGRGAANESKGKEH